MNKEQTLKAVEVMRAYAEGNRIECRRRQRGAIGAWTGVVSPSWDWDEIEYRTKPEPIEFEVWYNPNPGGPWRCALSVEDGDDEAYWKGKGYTKIKVRERRTK